MVEKQLPSLFGCSLHSMIKSTQNGISNTQVNELPEVLAKEVWDRINGIEFIVLAANSELLEIFSKYTSVPPTSFVVDFLCPQSYCRVTLELHDKPPVIWTINRNRINNNDKFFLRIGNLYVETIQQEKHHISSFVPEFDGTQFVILDWLSNILHSCPTKICIRREHRIHEFSAWDSIKLCGELEIAKCYDSKFLHFVLTERHQLGLKTYINEVNWYNRVQVPFNVLETLSFTACHIDLTDYTFEKLEEFCATLLNNNSIRMCDIRTSSWTDDDLTQLKIRLGLLERPHNFVVPRASVQFPFREQNAFYFKNDDQTVLHFAFQTNPPSTSNLIRTYRTESPSHSP